jgi:hypothetical protein
MVAKRLIRQVHDDSVLREIVKEIELLSAADRAYVSRDSKDSKDAKASKNGISRGRKTEIRLSEEESREEREKRVENILLYLDTVGAGSDYESTRTRIEKRLRAALKQEYHEQREKEAKAAAKRRASPYSHEVHSAIKSEQDRDVFEPSSKGNDYYKLFEDKKKGIGIYYYAPSGNKKRDDEKEGFHVYTPSGITIQRVPQVELGNGVLGVAYIGLNLIKILDTLYGTDFEEVKKHEVLHHQYPSMSEGWIRNKTKEEMPYGTKYQ